MNKSERKEIPIAANTASILGYLFQKKPIQLDGLSCMSRFSISNRNSFSFLYSMQAMPHTFWISSHFIGTVTRHRHRIFDIISRNLLVFVLHGKRTICKINCRRLDTWQFINCSLNTCLTTTYSRSLKNKGFCTSRSKAVTARKRVNPRERMFSLFKIFLKIRNVANDLILDP